MNQIVGAGNRSSGSIKHSAFTLKLGKFWAKGVSTVPHLQANQRARKEIIEIDVWTSEHSERLISWRLVDLIRGKH